MTDIVTPHDALIYAMVMASAVDRTMSDNELARIGEIVQHLPVFSSFDPDRLIAAAQRCTDILSGAEGLDIALETIRDALPAQLYDTAYALAVEVIAADRQIVAEEIRLLQLLAARLSLDKLTCAAIERAAQARYRSA